MPETSPSIHDHLEMKHPRRFFARCSVVKHISSRIICQRPKNTKATYSTIRVLSICSWSRTHTHTHKPYKAKHSQQLPVECHTYVPLTKITTTNDNSSARDTVYNIKQTLRIMLSTLQGIEKSHKQKQHSSVFLKIGTTT